MIFRPIGLFYKLKTYGVSQHKMKIWQFIGIIIFWSVICFPIFIEVGGLLGLK